MERIPIKNFTLPELESWIETIGERRFRARQIFRHVYARRIRSWSECSDLGKLFRVQLEHGTELDVLTEVQKREASDGAVKYLFQLRDGLTIESVLIPDPPRYTLCLSSQVGCALGCKFCYTGTIGFKRNLSTAEIIDQVCQIQHDQGSRKRITNIVYMGMGEPLANFDAVVRSIDILTDPNGMAFSHRRITLSTVGLVPELRRLGEKSSVNLAISLHAPDDALRSELMPINRIHSLSKLIQACKEYPLSPRKRITFEYILLEGINDDASHARRIVKLLTGVKSKINLIPFNPHPMSEFGRPSEESILHFQEVLQQANLTVLIRESRGVDIGAACGQLAARHNAGRSRTVSPDDSGRMIQVVGKAP